MKLVEFFERQIGESVGAPVRIGSMNNLVYPVPGSEGKLLMFSLGPIFSLVLVVLFVWPNLWQRLTHASDEGRLVSQAV